MEVNGYRECTAEIETRMQFAAFCYYCGGKGGVSVKLFSPRSRGLKLLSLLHCRVKSVVWQLGLRVFVKALLPPDGFFSVILRRRTLFSIFILFYFI